MFYYRQQTVKLFNVRQYILFNFGDVLRDFSNWGFKRIALLLKIEKVPSVHFLKECTYLVYQFLYWIYAPYLFSFQLLK